VYQNRSFYGMVVVHQTTMEISVREAARQLGLSPRRVRVLAAAGRLPARRIDERHWVVDVDAARRAHSRRLAGRPLSPRSCWAILALAEGWDLIGLSASERQRARGRLAALGDLPPRALSARAISHRFAGHRGVLGRLADDDRLVLSGASGAQRYGADIVALERVEAYVRDDHLDAVADDFALRSAAEGQENVLLRVPQPTWPFPETSRFAPQTVVAIDLIDAGDDRSVRAGQKLLSAGLAQAAAR
jgi:hypothetical protein